MINNEIQTTILRGLLNNESFTRKAIPFIKREYFEDVHQDIFAEIIKFVGKYNKLPNGEALAIDLQDSNITDGQYANAQDVLGEISREDNTVNEEWLLEQTEKWCQDRAIYLAILESIKVIDGQHETYTKDALPSILQDALGVCFDSSIGHDYFNDAEERYEFYHHTEECIPFDLKYFNLITKGLGLPKKSLSVILASTGVGKSLFMCHHAAAVLSQGKNVLYITMEMAEERIAERIDANLFNLPIDQLTDLPKEMYMKKVDKISKKNSGQLIIKEYPTGSAHAGHFRALLNELKLKKNFIPDMIFIDYLNICSSSRLKGLGGAVNSYSLVKSIAEELRGLSVEFKTPVMTATQANRGGFKNTDMDLDNTSESWGLPATADFMFALIGTEELEKLNQIMIKQLKNRYSDIGKNSKFLVGIDRSKMRLYDVEESAQTLMDDSPSKGPDKPINNFGSREKPKKDYSDFKM